MFAPDSVFDKPPSKPRGFYYPSLFAQQHKDEGVPSVVQDKNNGKYPTKINPRSSNNPDKITSTMKSNSPCMSDSCSDKFTSDSTHTSKENVGTSVDDLIREIDRDLLDGPDSNLPIPQSKPDIGNILSVSDNSDTNVKVMSPASLRYYMDRFKHAEPSHPSRRSDDNKQQMVHSESNTAQLDPQSGESDLDYSSVLLNTSSFLDVVVSSDDTSGSGQSSLLASEKLPESNMSKPVACTSGKGVSHDSYSYVKHLTGKSFSELANIVPKEIINPANENEDILYQWRLKRKIVDAQKVHCTEMIPEVVMNDASNVKIPCKSADQAKSIVTEKNSCTVEIQTDAERVESSCQVDLVKTCSLEQIQLEESPVLDQDSCSDISISDLDTLSDDLTDISDLDDIDITKIDDTEKLDRDVVSEQSANDSMETLQSDRQTPTCEDVGSPAKASIQVNRVDEANLQSAGLPHVGGNMSADDLNELKLHLDNIKESFDDELLTTFVDKYKLLLDQMKSIELVLEQRCNED